MVFNIIERFSRRKLPSFDECAPARGSSRFVGYCNPDDLVGKRGYAVYDEMQRDAQVQACLAIKKASVLSRGWQIHPASQSDEDVRIADFVTFALNDMRGSILDVLYNALDAIAKGFSVMEINYRLIEDGAYSGLVGLESIKSKNPADFEFDLDEYLNIKALKRVGLPGDALPIEKFVLYSYSPSYESPYGSSDLRAAYKHYWSKDVLMRFLNLYLEKYGSPTAKGCYRRGTPKNAQDELLKVLDKIAHESAIVIPDDVTVELLEAGRGGEAGYLQAMDFHDKQISKAILGQTLLTDEGMKVGSFALAKVHLDVLRMCLKKLKRDLEENVMGEQVIRRLVGYNFEGAACPSFSLGNLDERDFESMAGAISQLVSGGVIDKDESWIREYLGTPERET